MPYDELIKWTQFFKKRPIGYQEDNRTFMLLKALGAKGNGEDYFTSLRLHKEAEENRKTANAGKVLPTGKFLQMMKNAKNGDNVKLNWNK